MTYRISDEYIRKRRREMLIMVGIFVFVGVMIGWIGLSRDEYILFVFTLLLVFCGWKTYKNFIQWQRNDAIHTRFSVQGERFVMESQKFRREESLSDIKKIVLQYKKGKLLSVLIYSPNSLGKLIGIEDLELLAKDIEQVIGSDKVKVARFFHR